MNQGQLQRKTRSPPALRNRRMEPPEPSHLTSTARQKNAVEGMLSPEGYLQHNGAECQPYHHIVNKAPASQRFQESVTATAHPPAIHSHL